MRRVRSCRSGRVRQRDGQREMERTVGMEGKNVGRREAEPGHRGIRRRERKSVKKEAGEEMKLEMGRERERGGRRRRGGEPWGARGRRGLLARPRARPTGAECCVSPHSRALGSSGKQCTRPRVLQQAGRRQGLRRPGRKAEPTLQPCLSHFLQHEGPVPRAGT